MSPKDILARVEYPADRSRVADLREDGWLADPDEPATLNSLLDHAANPSDYGPADGDPIARAAAAAAELLGGTVAFVREPDPVPPDAVF